MSVRGIPAPPRYRPSVYWEDRAQRFAAERDGLAAICAYGMPEFYNRAIDLEQRVALAPWLRVSKGTRVLDVGCGVGRWSRLLAAEGARVFGVDLSPTMVAQARRRAALEGVAERCHFAVSDLAQLDLRKRFDLVLGVTVLQHILDPAALHEAISALAAHLAPGGRMVLLEAAPVDAADRCDSTVFVARPRRFYLDAFRNCGLRAQTITGVDPAPFRRHLVPYLRRIPAPWSMAMFGLVTALSLPINLLFGRFAARQSWHAVFVLRREDRGP
jgi:SAM-dependent methyltransferase